jgi:hypothetical protein
MYLVVGLTGQQIVVKLLNMCLDFGLRVACLARLHAACLNRTGFRGGLLA